MENHGKHTCRRDYKWEALWSSVNNMEGFSCFICFNFVSGYLQKSLLLLCIMKMIKHNNYYSCLWLLLLYSNKWSHVQKTTYIKMNTRDVKDRRLLKLTQQYCRKLLYDFPNTVMLKKSNSCSKAHNMFFYCLVSKVLLYE